MDSQITHAVQVSNPHLVLIPFMAQGHMIPMVDMARLLAIRGAQVTFITTPLNAARIAPFIRRAKSSSLRIDFVQIPFPFAETGLPDGCENSDLIISPDHFLAFHKALTFLSQPIYLHLLRGRKPDCIISDSLLPWTAGIARDLAVPRFVFPGPPAFYLLCLHNLEREKTNLDRLNAGEHELLAVPGLQLPQEIRVSKAQSRIWPETPEWKEIAESIRLGEELADGVIINSFKELEPWFIECYRKAIAKPVWPIGPLSLCTDGKDARGKPSNVDTEQLLSWLDAKQPRSVVLVSFGSLVHSSLAQLLEISHGLEATKRPFIWVMKEAEWAAEIEEKTSGRGLVIKGWAPQLLILNHAAVGGFMTHCGWNSVLEAVAAGVPMATWPRFGDQFLNERQVVELLSIGVGVARADLQPGFFVDGGSFQVGRDEVEKAVKRLMDEGEEGEGRRERVRELGEKARRAVEEGGSSFDSLTLLIQTLHL